jgi:hypothetical protein
MATYVNNLRLKEITTGDEDGTWGTSTNTNLELITDGFSYGTKEIAADANETFTMPDATADATRSLYLKITSAVSLTATREVTLGPNTVSKTWIIENATSGSQIITIKQGSGATVNVLTALKSWSSQTVRAQALRFFNANPTEVGGTVTSVGGTGTVNGITLTGTVTSSGNLTLGGGNSVTATVTGAVTWTFSNPTASDEMCGFSLKLVNGGSAAQTWPASVDWPSATAPTLTASGTDVLVFFTVDGGTTWYGFVAGLALA